MLLPNNMEENKDVNLDAQRDERCIPVVREILKEFSTDLMNTDGNYNPVVVKTLSTMLAADLNTTSEVSYISQLLLGVFSSLNQTLQTCDIGENDDAKYDRVTNKILSIISDANVHLVNPSPADVAADFAPIKEDLNKLFAEEKLTKLDVKYIMDNLLNAFTSVNNLVGIQVENAIQRMTEKAVGVESLSDITLKKIDAFLLSEVK